jgi:DNA-binding Lrp family transcriptional regulator
LSSVFCHKVKKIILTFVENFYMILTTISERIFTETEISMAENKRFDSLDYCILQELHRDGRAPATEIAVRVGADARTVRNRILRLVELGAIRLTAIADPSAFGYQTAADIFLEVDPTREPELIDRFLSMREISYIAYGAGSGEISLEVRFKNNAELREFLVHCLPSIPGVRSLRHTLVPQILKNIDEWMPGQEDFALTDVA